jgi:hypothetical protein
MLHNIIITLIFFFMRDCYRIESSLFIKTEFIENKNCIVEKKYELKTNNASIYEFKKGEIIMLPSYGDEGIIFESDTCFNYYLNKDVFPIENSDKNIYEKHSNVFFEMSQNIAVFQANLNEITGFNYNEITLPILKKYYTSLISKKNKRILHDSFISMGVLIGEYLRREKNGKWGLLKYYGVFNPYYEPIIIDDKGITYNVHSDYQLFMTNGENLDFFLKMLELYNANINIEQYLNVRGKDYVIILP